MKIMTDRHYESEINKAYCKGYEVRKREESVEEIKHIAHEHSYTNEAGKREEMFNSDTPKYTVNELRESMGFDRIEEWHSSYLEKLIRLGEF